MIFKATMYKSSLSLLAGFTSSSPTALKDTWFQEISECGHIILEKVSFAKGEQRG